MRADRVRVLICDDHALFRAGIRAILQDQPWIDVVGEAPNGREAVEQAERLQPHVILMDMEMPELNGLEATRRLREAGVAAKVLILTMYAEDELVARCLEAGAAGYVLKDEPAEQLVYAIKAASTGGRYLSPIAAEGVILSSQAGATRPETRYDSLTGREREVFKLLTDGCSGKEIAVSLRLSVKTVDVHKTNMMRKLGVHDRAELMKYALQNRLIRLPIMG
ncbi:MAG: response regulator [Solirubrobacterales bacterium]